MPPRTESHPPVVPIETIPIAPVTVGHAWQDDDEDYCTCDECIRFSREWALTHDYLSRFPARL